MLVRNAGLDGLAQGCIPDFLEVDVENVIGLGEKEVGDLRAPEVVIGRALILVVPWFFLVLVGISLFVLGTANPRVVAGTTFLGFLVLALEKHQPGGETQDDHANAGQGEPDHHLVLVGVVITGFFLGFLLGGGCFFRCGFFLVLPAATLLLGLGGDGSAGLGLVRFSIRICFGTGRGLLARFL